MTTSRPLAAIARSAGAHPWRTLVVWAALLGIAVATAIGGITGETLSDRLQGSAPVANSESSAADDILAGSESGAAQVTLLVHGVDLNDPALAAVASTLSSTFSASEFVNPLLIPTQPDGSRVPAVASLFSADGRGVLFVVSSDRPTTTSTLVGLRDQLRESLPTATVEVGSGELLFESIISISENDLRRGEAVALPIALVILLIVFGGFLAAGVPLLGAIVSILGALGALFGLSFLMDIDTTVTNVITAVGLGLSIDYGLLIVSRFREEYRVLSAAAPPEHARERRELRLTAIGRTADSAGRTVLYSGITFAIASLGLLVFDLSIVRAIGIGALAVTLIAIASALTLVPALLGLAGERLVRPGALTRLPWLGSLLRGFGDIAPDDGFFSRLTRWVQRRPAAVTISCVILLAILAAPALSLRLATTSTDGVPSSSSQSTFVTTLAQQFPDAASPRVELVSGSQADAESWATTVERLDLVTSVSAPLQVGDGWRSVVRVTPTDGVEVVREIRADRPRATALVTGTAARTLDFSEALLNRAPLALLIVALGTITLLFLMTGSLVVPLKALAASALSLGATMGILVWGFQYGNLAGLMNFTPADVLGVDVLVIVLALAFGFGLAMDYEMFILSRVKEGVDAGLDGRVAIARGLQRSGRIITSAAITIVVVFAGFATGDLMVIKQLGVALAVAVVLDASLVRMLLVPAFMTWQIAIMWWAPRWMKRLHERFGLREG